MARYTIAVLSFILVMGYAFLQNTKSDEAMPSRLPASAETLGTGGQKSPSASEAFPVSQDGNVAHVQHLAIQTSKNPCKNELEKCRAAYRLNGLCYSEKDNGPARWPKECGTYFKPFSEDYQNAAGERMDQVQSTQRAETECEMQNHYRPNPDDSNLRCNYDWKSDPSI